MVLIKVFSEIDYDYYCFIRKSVDEFRKENADQGYKENEDFRITNVLDLWFDHSYSYQGNKTIIRGLAVEYSNDFMLCDMDCETANRIAAWFERYGKRYGLLTEFRENGII